MVVSLKPSIEDHTNNVVIKESAEGSQGSPSDWPACFLRGDDSQKGLQVVQWVHIRPICMLRSLLT